MSSNKYAQEIIKTGFELEFRVSEVFRQLGWTVIANKYYVDDHSGTVREIDLVAYRTTKVQDFRVATVVVVSCKKNERDAWVLLAKDVDRRDPNTEWQPLHTWSNHRVLKHMLEKSDWRLEYAAFVAQRSCADLIQIPNRHIFAFQEMSKTTGNGTLRGVLKALAADLHARGGLDLSETFIDGSFASAKKKGSTSERPSGAKGRRSWRLQTALVFLSPLPSPPRRRTKRRSSNKP